MKKYIYLIAGILVGAIIIGGGVSIYRKNEQIDSLTHENQELRRLVEIDNDIFKDVGNALMNVSIVLEADNIFSMEAAMIDLERYLAQNAEAGEARKAERKDLYKTLFEEKE